MLGTIAITPSELLVLVAVIAVVRFVLTLQPVAAGAGAGRRAFAREYLDPFIYAGIGAFLLITFVARTYYIPSGSMEPTLQIGDVLIVNKFQYRLAPPREGDIVVFPPPIETTDDFIKRVIGRPGDRLRIVDGTVFVNDKPLVEPYIAEKPNYTLQIRNYAIYYNGLPLETSGANIPPRSQWTAPDRIPPHCYFLMGDNRNNSDDSSHWGFAQDAGTFATGPRAGQAAHFTGHAFVIFWPLSHARLL